MVYRRLPAFFLALPLLAVSGSAGLTALMRAELYTSQCEQTYTYGCIRTALVPVPQELVQRPGPACE